ncbi:hypothetical protein QM012_002583 [Aureobasidium pullulans]|uniref:Uncharacterized protein n=1 Tax=Aureobasidium pullulans TaxID=5580 RepID=A0ABR0TAW7_AURPU
MSAEDLGTRELGQVRSQRLDELLTTLRLLQDPSSNSRIGIPALDKLLASHTTRFDPINLSSVPAPPIIEVTSPVPKSGKTELLYWVIAKLVFGSDDLDTPQQAEVNHDMKDGTRTSDHAEDDVKQHTEDGSTLDAHTDDTAHEATEQSHNHKVQGTNLREESNRVTPKAVALLSTTPVNISRLSQVLLQHLLGTKPNLPLAEAQLTIHTALSHIHIYQPTSLTSLIATLSSLPSYFLSPTNNSKDKMLGAILLNTPSTYFWEDKFSFSTSPQSTTKFPALATTLRRVSSHLQTPIIYTTSSLSSASTSSNPLSLQPALPSPFGALPSLRLIIARDRVQGFSQETDAETAVKQRKARDLAVKKKKFRVSVNQWGNEDRSGSDREREQRGFEVQIDDRGVMVI